MPESLAARSLDRALRGIHELKALGVRISVSGFGGGGGSLSALRELPVDVLEVDGAFVRGLGESDTDETFAATVLAIARSLRLVAVADGVESERQLEVLLSHDARRAKGRLFGEPASAESLRQVLETADAGRVPS
jgi:EAL domain-containing protein (putative c-di-GMP-specific phosphodiesterase class I)